MTPLETLTRERAKFGARIWPWDAVRILNAVAWTHRDNIALVVAPAAGNGWVHPAGFIRTGHLADVLDRRVFDVFEDGPDRDPVRAGRAVAQWHEAGPLDVGTVAPVRPITLVVPGEEEAPAGEEPTREEPTRPEAPATVEEVLALLLPPLADMVRAVEQLAAATLAQAAQLEKANRDGIRLKLR